MIDKWLPFFLAKEEKLISTQIQKDFLSKKDDLQPLSQQDILLINASLLVTDASNAAFKVHRHLTNSLISIYLNSKHCNEITALRAIFHFEDFMLSDTISESYIEFIPGIIEELHIAFLNSEFSISNGKLTRKKSKHYLKETGSVYTLKQISLEIVQNSIDNLSNDILVPESITCLDFASGTGRFYFKAIDVLHSKFKLSIEQIICNNIFAVDIDETAIAILRCKVISLFETITPSIINALAVNILNRNALIPKVNLLQNDENSIDLSLDFKKVFSTGGFDIIFSNPPYCLLKVNKKEEHRLKDYYANLQNKIENEIHFFRTSGIYHYSIEGMLNYYQLSIEMIIRLTKPKGQIGIICPSSLFADLTSAKLRKHILTAHKLLAVKYYPESSKLFENVSQSTVIFYFQKSSKTNSIGIEVSGNKFEVSLETIKKIFPANFEIPLIDQTGWSILSKISLQKKMKEISFLRNRRGELDLTLFKSFITNCNTGWRLVRGNMIGDQGVIDKNNEFVDVNNFLEKKSEDFKVNDFNKKRLICQQVSNVDLQKRLKFVFSEQTDILGNSCNYIVSARNESDLHKLYFILNSTLLNWRFKITSSNNHINNYELDELPIIDLDMFNIDQNNEDVGNEKAICKQYGLTKLETEYIFTNSTKITSPLLYEQEIV